MPPGGRMLHIHLTVCDAPRAQLGIPECFCWETLSRSPRSPLILLEDLLFINFNHYDCVMSLLVQISAARRSKDGGFSSGFLPQLGRHEPRVSELVRASVWRLSPAANTTSPC